MSRGSRWLGRFSTCTCIYACAVVALPLALSGCYDGAPAPDVAPVVDLERFQGKWYEIAKLPRMTETDCTGTVASYWLRVDGDLDMKSECHVGGLDGPLKSVTANMKVPDRGAPAKLALQVHGFYGDYWILELGDDYEYAVIGHPSREYLWILSRTSALAPQKLDAVLKHAKAAQFAVERLEYTIQLP